MARFLRNPVTGKFVGSIGEGKNNVPTASQIPYSATNPYVKRVLPVPTSEEKRLALRSFPESLEESIQVWTYKRPWTLGKQGACNRAYRATTIEELMAEIRVYDTILDNYAPTIIGAYWNPKVLDGTLDPVEVMAENQRKARDYSNRSYFDEAFEKLPFGKQTLTLLSEVKENHHPLVLRRTWLPEEAQKNIAEDVTGFAYKLAKREEISDATKILLSTSHIRHPKNLETKSILLNLSTQPRLPVEALNNLLATKNPNIYERLAARSQKLPPHIWDILANQTWDAKIIEQNINRKIAANKSAPEHIRAVAALRS